MNVTKLRARRSQLALRVCVVLCILRLRYAGSFFSSTGRFLASRCANPAFANFQLAQTSGSAFSLAPPSLQCAILALNHP